ncbi:MAG: hypothetical protein LBS87_02825 [Puniceicoccales bacterium]|jgi:hypothetical protein|nr:hypothetical protein [Puniceicoccales bacterium]
MRDSVIMRCGTNYVALAMFDDSGKFTDALSYPIHHDGSGDEAWLAALSKTIEEIPSDFKLNTVLVIPPNNKIFVKYLELPEVEKDNHRQALKFEFQRNFPGSEEEWIWDTYHCEVEDNGAFVVAMQRIFAERLLDILLRRKINFSYLCPEIVLDAIALQEHVKDFQSTMLLHIGSESSLISVNGKNVQHVRMVPLAFDWVDGQISNSQQIPAPDARKIKLEYVQKLSQSPAGLTFITYYIRQFANKMQQELKRSELFFCRKFNQSPIKRIILSGKCMDIVTFSEVIAELNANTKIETANKVMEGALGESLDGAKRDILSHNIFAYVGASSCVLENKTKLINLFSEDFKNQISFQRRHPSYMAAMVTVVFASILGLKLLSQKVNLLEFKKLALEAKLRESALDTQKYHETITSERRLRDSIVKIKGALYSQDAWISLFSDLQQSIKILKTSWIDSLKWNDFIDNDGRDTVHVVAKIFIDDREKSDEVAGDIERFLTSLRQSNSVAETVNTVISPVENSVLTFSFDIKLNQDSQILQ